MFAVGDVYESGATSFPDDFAFFNFEPQITLERIVSVTTFNVDKFLTFRIAKILNDDPRDNDRDLKKFHLKKKFQKSQNLRVKKPGIRFWHTFERLVLTISSNYLYKL